VLKSLNSYRQSFNDKFLHASPVETYKKVESTKKSLRSDPRWVEFNRATNTLILYWVVAVIVLFCATLVVARVVWGGD